MLQVKQQNERIAKTYQKLNQGRVSTMCARMLRGRLAEGFERWRDDVAHSRRLGVKMRVAALVWTKQQARAMISRWRAKVLAEREERVAAKLRQKEKEVKEL